MHLLDNSAGLQGLDKYKNHKLVKEGLRTPD